MNNGNQNTQRWDRYSDGRWSELLREAREIQQEYARGGLSEAELHRKADRLRELRGGAVAAAALIPKVIAEHRRGGEWGLERLLVSARKLEDLPYVGPEERGAVDQRIAGVIGRIDAAELEAAEQQVRELEAHVERLQRASLEAEFNALLAGIGEMYQPAA
jgi:hypothetical protein